MSTQAKAPGTPTILVTIRPITVQQIEKTQAEIVANPRAAAVRILELETWKAAVDAMSIATLVERMAS